MLEKKIDNLKRIFKTSSKLNPLLRTLQGKRDELRDQLTALYSIPTHGDVYMVCEKLAHVQDAFKEEHEAARLRWMCDILK